MNHNKKNNGVLSNSDKLKQKYKESEDYLRGRIQRQLLLIEKLKAESQSKMADILKDGSNARIAKFKTAQIKINQVVAAQEELMLLKKKLKELIEIHKGRQGGLYNQK